MSAIKYTNIEMVEGTTRFVEITCKDQNGQEFDFTGYDVRTWLSWGGTYISTVVVGNLVSFEIPAQISVGKRNGVVETRIFKDGKVFEIIRIRLNVVDAKKPDLVPVNM